MNSRRQVENEANLQRLLETNTFGRSVQWHEELESTNSTAALWAERDIPDGSIVVADYQTRGRGRFDRTWQADKGKNLTFSIVLFPGIVASKLGLLPAAFAVVIAEHISVMLNGQRAGVKWPNDILIKGKKVCGILMESTIQSGRSAPNRVVMGIGLNVNQTRFPAGLAREPTSLAKETETEHDRIVLLAALLGDFERVYNALHSGGVSEIVTRYEARLENLGEEIVFDGANGTGRVAGRIMGIDTTGALSVMTDRGIVAVCGGEVSLRNADNK